LRNSSRRSDRARISLRVVGKLGPFIYTTIVFTALIDWVVWDHPPTRRRPGHGAVIGGGLVAIVARPRRRWRHRELTVNTKA